MTLSNTFEFTPEKSDSNFDKPLGNSLTPWKILSVEDDLDYQESLVFAIKDMTFQSRAVEILTANSAAEAAQVLVQQHDIAVILLDVVMEEDDAGLRLINTIRNVQGNSAVRIILLTGQPSFAPRLNVMQEHDIDEYWNKAEIQQDMLCSVLSAHLRTWHTLTELKQATLGLQMVVDASRSLSSKYDLDSFTHVVMKEIAHVINASEDSIICVSKPCKYRADDVHQHAKIVAATGNFSRYLDHEFDQDIQKQFGEIYNLAIKNGSHQFNNLHSALYFPGDGVLAEYYLILVNNEQPLTNYHINLLQVFSENIASGFANIAFVNRLNHLAYKDQLLNIYNRTWFQRELAAMSYDDKCNTELLILDVNQFTTKVLTFGEEHSTQLIKQLYKSILNVTNERHIISRVGTDTFAILCPKSDVLNLTALYSLIDQPVAIEGIAHNLGITIVRMDLCLLKELAPNKVLYLALSTLSIAHQQNLSLFDYSPELLDKMTGESEIMHGLRNAIIQSELFIVLQPKVNLKSNAVIGFEALLRWKRGNEYVSPAKFIPVAEQSGLINQLDQFVFLETVSAQQQLTEQGYQLPISFNATCADLKNEAYINTVISVIEKGDINPKLLDLEITESQAMLDYKELNPVLMRFRQLGLNISIDDFGTGYSSLAHIAKLPATTIKIDRTFVTNIENDQSSYHVVDMVMGLANKFGFSVIAEGIETEGQQNMLLKHGCDKGQGFLFSKPQPLSEILAWLPTQTVD
ncbi:EAL domain-containing protein [Colwellia sp. E2M01]|uniref:EAL domain-containing protein n=1 Tax=Colwellia sp. E2M01 TaxID=2841561 RepID=UPI001C09F6F8|nr:EAL domain-containing protein [Colwellia sp. E2M01]MBU2870678.1 EAL domain-containing protein [Colwellia sp. E2M01]